VLQRNTETLTGLISGLVDISRIATGTFSLNFEAVDLKEVVRSSVETLQIQTTRRGVALKSVVEIPPKTACMVWGGGPAASPGKYFEQCPQIYA